MKNGSKKISFVGNNIRLVDFFNAVWDQTHVQAFFNDEQLDSELRMDFNFHDESLDNVLAYIVRKKKLTWYYREETVVILPKKPGDPDMGKLPEDERNISGDVKQQKDQLIPGIAVMVKGTTKGTLTDQEGRFRLSKVKGTDQLIARGYGYYPATVAVANKDTINIKLTESVTLLDAVRVLANSRKYTTGVKSFITQENIDDQPVSNVLNTLQGRVSGLFINQTTGLPGAGYKTRLRGNNSIQNGNSPLVVVDGVPYPIAPFNDDYLNSTGASGIALGTNIAASPLNMINVADIAMVEVLKDAEASSLYGSRGVNGVIAITTKSSLPGDDHVNINAYSGIGQAAHLVRYLNTAQYLTMRKEGYK